MKVEVEVGERTVIVELDKSSGALHAKVNGRPLAVEATWRSRTAVSLLVDGRSHDFEIARRANGEIDVHHGSGTVKCRFRGAGPASGTGVRRENAGVLTAPMPGKVIAVLVAEGDTVEAGQGVVVVEAMKMENEIQPSCAGRVKKIFVTPGQVVEGDAPLMEIG